MATRQAPPKVEQAVRRSRGASARGRQAAAPPSEAQGTQRAALLEVDLGRRCAAASAVAWATLATLGTLIYLDTPPFQDPLGVAAFFSFLLPFGPGLAGLAVSGSAFMSKRGRLISGHLSEHHNIMMFLGIGLASLVIAIAISVQAGLLDPTVAQASYPLGVMSITLGMLGYILTWTEWSNRKLVAALCSIVPMLLSFVHLAYPPAGQVALVVWEYHVGGALYMVSGVLFVVSMTATTGAEREIVKGANERLAMEAARIKTRNRELDKALAQTAERAAQIEEEEAKAEADSRAAEERLATAERLKAEAARLQEVAATKEAAASQQLAKVQAELASHEARARELSALAARAKERELELSSYEESQLADRTKAQEEQLRVERDRRVAEQQLAHAKREREAARDSLEAAERKVREAEAARQEAMDLRSRARDALSVAEARAVEADGARGEALSRVERELGEEREQLEAERQSLADERARVERLERDAKERMQSLESRAKEIEGIQVSLSEKISQAAREKAEAEALRRAAEAEAADAGARAKAYTSSYAAVKELETRAEQAQADLRKAEERMAARERKLKDYEAELSRRAQQQLAERKGLAGQKERLSTQEARLKEREAAIFDLESTPDFAREALAALAGDMAPAAAAGAGAGAGAGAAPAGPGKSAPAAAGGGGAEPRGPAPSEPAEGRLSLGNARLDELVGGGLPTGSSLLVVGPAFCGKEAIPLGFVADGLERGVPAIIVTTVRSPAEVLDELDLMLSPASKGRTRTLLRWVDASGKGHRGDAPRDHVVDVASPADFGRIKAAIGDHFEHLGGEHPTFRLVYMPLTESWRHAEPEVARTFLQQLVAAVRKQEAGAVFVAESGIHSTDEVEALAGMVAGVIRLQEEREGHALRAQGVPGTRTQGWVRYRHSPKGIELGAFELERIR